MIITPQKIEKEQAAREAEQEIWQAFYDKFEQVRKLADKIHAARLMAGPACSQCIEIAVKRLIQQPEGDAEKPDDSLPEDAEDERS